MDLGFWLDIGQLVALQPYDYNPQYYAAKSMILPRQ
jgi:hypothetical protein